MATDLAAAPVTRSDRGVRFATALLWTDGIAAGAGLTSLLLGRVWTVPVELCDRTMGRRGADPLWVASLGGLALAAVVTVVALVSSVVALIRHDDRAAVRSGLAVLLGLSAGAACFWGAMVVLGDSPLFCF